MEEKEKESTSFDETVCIMNFESSEAFLKRKENASTIDNKQRLNLCKSVKRIKSSSSRSGCSKLCTEYRKTGLDGAQTLNCKPQTLRESSSRQKKSETKPTGEMPLYDQLKTKMKETSKKLQSTMPLFKKTTKRSLTKMKSLFGFRTRRVLGFKCDLRKCDSTLIECSTSACKKKSMIFGESSHSCDLKMTDSNISDSLTISSSSEQKL